MNGLWMRLLGVLVVSFVAIGAGAQTVEVAGVKFEPTAQVGGATLQLNGAGVRTRVVFKVYAAGLYVPEKSSSAAALLAQKGPRRMAIRMLRNVDADTFSGALSEGLKNNLSEAQFAAFKAHTETLIANFKTAGEAKEGDTIFLEFAPDAGTRVIVNGNVQGSAIAGEDYFAALLRIWLGDKPADPDLKKGLLGS
jgi:hypothetical protein